MGQVRTKASTSSGRATARGRRGAGPAPARPSLTGASGIVALQQSAGNAAVVQALAVQRDVSGTNPIVNLRKGDGLTTFGARKNVTILQERLNDLPQGDVLKTDGMWGNGTQATFNAVQQDVGDAASQVVDPELGDAIMGGPSGVETLKAKHKGRDQPPPTDQDPPNALLDAELAGLTLDYTRTIIEQRNGVDVLDRDLRNLDARQRNAPVIAGIMGQLVDKGFEALLGIAPIGTVIKAVDDALEKVDAGLGAASKVSPALKGVSTKKIFDDALKKAQEVTKAAIVGFAGDTPDNPLKKPAPDAFIDSQREGTSESGVKIQETFLNEVQPELRKLQGTEQVDPNALGNDPRLARAQAVHAGVRAGRDRAKNDQLIQSTNKWLTYSAQQEAGSHTAFTVDGKQTTATNLNTTTARAAGVLRFPVNDDGSVATAKIGGANDALRTRLRTEKVGETGIPRIIERKTSPFFGSGVFTLLLTKDEVGEVGVVSYRFQDATANQMMHLFAGKGLVNSGTDDLTPTDQARAAAGWFSKVVDPNTTEVDNS